MPKNNAARQSAYIARLQNAIRRLNGCESRYVETVTVDECILSFQQSTVWQGEVTVFELYGHPQTKRAYAWPAKRGTEAAGYIVVLEIPPVTSPQTAVQAAITAQIVHGTRNV